MPKARIRTEKIEGQQKHIELTWDNDETLPEFIPGPNLVDPQKEYEECETNCKTRKDIGSLYHRRTAGIFIAAWPCGTIAFVVEIYGTENISQVHGLLCDFIYQNSLKVDWILYDDACHRVR